jgi:hypothetical protein
MVNRFQQYIIILKMRNRQNNLTEYFYLAPDGRSFSQVNCGLVTMLLWFDDFEKKSCFCLPVTKENEK